LEILKIKGLARADKKANKEVREGAIGAFVS
jgi:translation elongation factor EF-Ts